VRNLLVRFSWMAVTSSDVGVLSEEDMIYLQQGKRCRYVRVFEFVIYGEEIGAEDARPFAIKSDLNLLVAKAGTMAVRGRITAP
jgi:hypothetical protein